MTTHQNPDSAEANSLHSAGLSSEAASKPLWIGNFAVIWGIAGVIALLSMATIRLATISIAAFGFSLTWTHWTVLALSVVFMAYTEGYKTFQKIWAPRVVGRAFELKKQWTPLQVALAPLYSMSFFQATRRRMITAWVTTACIVLLVIFMNQISQPWRGLVDAGVVVGLCWGVASLLFQTAKAIGKKTSKKH